MDIFRCSKTSVLQGRVIVHHAPEKVLLPPRVLNFVTPTLLQRRSTATSSLRKGTIVSRLDTGPKKAHDLSHPDRYYPMCTRYHAFL
jgi:hypothetical protein